jgi:hypothetical protein
MDPIVAELKRIAQDQDGILDPQYIVDSARDPESPLHSRFDWEDSSAAEKWRLHQARNLIRVTVSYLPQVHCEPTRVFVSLTTDRKDGGYRQTVDVLHDSNMRRQLLTDALDELRRLQRKYSLLKELAGVFEAARQVELRLQDDVPMEAVL